MPRASAIAREREPDTYVPFVGHAAPNVILLDDGALLAMLALDGTAWETADVDDVNARHSQRNLLLRNIASERLVLATHTVRTMADATVYPVERCRSPFAQDLDEAYRRRLFSDRLFRNELFLSVLFRAPQAPAPGLSILFGRRRRGDTRQIASTADLDRLEAIVATVEAELRAYMPRRLGLRDRAGVLFSEAGEALRLILTGEHHPVPLVNGHLGGAIYTDRVIVGREAVEIRGPGRSTYAAGFGLREYPASTWPGMFDAVLGAPYRCVLTQTFAPLGKQDAQDRMTRKQNQMVVAGDKAASQTEALAEAADLLQGNAFVMGDHHLTLVTFADSLTALADVAAQARRDLAESGAVITREDLALEAVYLGSASGQHAPADPARRDQQPELRGDGLPAQLSAGSPAGSLGRSPDPVPDNRGNALPLPPARSDGDRHRSRQHLRAGTGGLRKDDAGSLPPGHGGTPRRSSRVLRQGPRRRNPRACSRRHISDTSLRPAVRLGAAQGPVRFTAGPRVPEAAADEPIWWMRASRFLRTSSDGLSKRCDR